MSDLAAKRVPMKKGTRPAVFAAAPPPAADDYMDSILSESWHMIDAIREQNEEMRKTHEADVVSRIAMEWTMQMGICENPQHRCGFKCRKKHIQIIDKSLNIYGCRKGGVVHRCRQNHTCDNAITNQDGDTICVFSGVIIGKVYQNNAFKKCVLGSDDTMDKEGDVRPPPRSAANTKTNSTLVKEAEKILFHLIWDVKKRQTLGEEREKQIETSMVKELMKYVNACKREKRCPVYVRIIEIIILKRNKRRLIPVVPPNEVMHKYLVTLIMNMWRFVTNTPYYKAKFRDFQFKQHVIGALYLMQDNYKFSGRIVIPRIDFLSLMLPAMEDIDRFSSRAIRFMKSDITDGINLLKDAFNSDPVNMTTFDFLS